MSKAPIYSEASRPTMFSKQHYEIIAKVVQEAYVPKFEAYVGWNSVRLKLAHMFKMDNPKFDEYRFLSACVPKGREAEVAMLLGKKHQP